jgi:Yip1 domain
MNIIERVKAIIIKPKATWQVIKEEKTDIKSLIINYAAPLALIPAVASLIGMTLIGIRLPSGVVRAPILASLIGGVMGYALNIVGLFIGAWVIKILAPTFNSKVDFTESLKIVVYSMTPAWIVGIFSVVPGLSILSILGLYGIYLLALGLPAVLTTPDNKVVWYTIAIILLSMVINFVLTAIIMGAVYGPIYMKMMSV